MKSLLSALSITVCTVTAAMTGAAAVGTAHAQSFQPAIVFDMGGKFDKSFNEAAYAGAERFKKESGIEYREFEVTQEAQREQALRTMARRGANVVVGVGFAQASAMEKVSQEFADTKFCIIDSVVERPNVQSITFKEHEGSFLVGMMAALASKTGKVGFVGGMDIPLIRNFATGYQQGVKHANPQAEIFQNMTGTTPAAWRDPTRGGELAKSQMDRGADVIYAAAGGTGIVAFYFENEDVLQAIHVDVERVDLRLVAAPHEISGQVAEPLIHRLRLHAAPGRNIGRIPLKLYECPAMTCRTGFFSGLPGLLQSLTTPHPAPA